MVSSSLWKMCREMFNAFYNNLESFEILRENTRKNAEILFYNDNGKQYNHLELMILTIPQQKLQFWKDLSSKRATSRTAGQIPGFFVLIRMHFWYQIHIWWYKLEFLNFLKISVKTLASCLHLTLTLRGLIFAWTQYHEQWHEKSSLSPSKMSQNHEEKNVKAQRFWSNLFPSDFFNPQSSGGASYRIQYKLNFE